MNLQYPQLYDPDWMEANAHRSAQDIMQEVGCSRATLYYAKAKMNVPCAGVRFPPLHDQRWIKRTRHRDPVELAREVGCSPWSVRKARRRFGFGADKGQWCSYPQLHDRWWMKRNARRSAPDVAEELGCHVDTVSNARKKMGLDGRTKERLRKASGMKVEQPRFQCNANCKYFDWCMSHKYSRFPCESV